jgi:hypothetical protein
LFLVQNLSADDKNSCCAKFPDLELQIKNIDSNLTKYMKSEKKVVPLDWPTEDDFSQPTSRGESKTKVCKKNIQQLKNEIQAVKESLENVTTTMITLFTWITIVLIFWNITLTIVGAFLWWSSSNQQSQSSKPYEITDGANSLYYAMGMSNHSNLTSEVPSYNVIPESRVERGPSNRRLGSKKIMVNPIYQPTLEHNDADLGSETPN